jgi:tRNA pseudouridine38-40 synthase
VHGFCQVVHFEASTSRSPKAWIMGGNANLPSDVRLHWAVPVPGDFHARFSATARRYRYVIANGPVRPALLSGQVCWQRRPLNASLMHLESQCLLGEQDFSCFRAAACQSTSPMRNVHSASVFRCGELVIVDIKANAFLHHMVRNIVGSLMAVGSGRKPPGWCAELLARGERALAADTAPADGLYLVDVEYPARYYLPPTPYGPLLLSGCCPGGA